MPNDRKKSAKKSAAAKRKGVRYVKSAYKKAAKGETKVAKARVGGVSNRKKEVKGITKIATAENLLSAGKKAIATGKKPASRRSLKVTPRSAAKKEAAKNPIMQPVKGATKKEIRKRNKPKKK